jgi:glycosyltransferase involved in cell wall biosynthesis
MPRVSVIIPTFQSVRFVQETIDSVLAQTYKGYEVIVVDGRSTDGTREVLYSYGNLIKVINQNDKGISNAKNIGVLASKGEYIAFVDSDDVWLPDKLEVQAKFLESKPDIVGLIYSDALYFADEKNSESRIRCFQMQNAHRGRVIEYLLRRNFIPASTVMVRKSCFEKIGLFDESLSISEDLDMWIRIAEYFEIDYQDLILAKIRSHPGSVTHDLERHFQSLITLQNKIMPYLLKIFKSKSFYRRYYRPYLDFGISYLLTSRTKNAKQKFGLYIKLYPYGISAYFLLLLTLFPFNLIIKTKLLRHIPSNLRETFRKNLAE